MNWTTPSIDLINQFNIDRIIHPKHEVIYFLKFIGTFTKTDHVLD